MAENDKSCWSGIVSAFFSGALLGAGVALLFAPVSGKEARQTIAREYEELKDKLKSLEKKLHKPGSKFMSGTADEEEL